MSVYAKLLEDESSATPLFMITVADDPGVDGAQPPACMIMCCGMYEWAADWLLEVLKNRPYPYTSNQKRPT